MRGYAILPWAGFNSSHAPRGAANLLEYALFRSGPLASNVFECTAFVRTQPNLDKPDIQVVFQTARRNKNTFPFPLGHGFAISIVGLYPKSRGRIFSSPWPSSTATGSTSTFGPLAMLPTFSP